MVYVWTIVIWGIQIALMLLSVVIGIKRKKLAQKTGRFYPWIVLGWNLVLFLGYVLVFFSCRLNSGIVLCDSERTRRYGCWSSLVCVWPGISICVPGIYHY